MVNLSFSNLWSLLSGGYKEVKPDVMGFSEEYPYEEGFSQHYDKYIKPKISDFEARRLDALQQAGLSIRVLTPAYILVVIGLGYALYQYQDLDTFITCCTAFVFTTLFYIFLISRSIKDYQDGLKKEIIPEILSFLGEFKYHLNSSGWVRGLMNSDIIPCYDDEQSEDVMEGAYKGVTIKLIETYLTERVRDRDGDRITTSVFSGLLIHLSITKRFSGKTIIFQDAGKIGNWIEAKSSSLERVAVEDSRFEDVFEVYSDTKAEAHELLTTDFIQHVFNLRHFFGKNIECAIFENTLLIKVETPKNLFEPGSIFEAEDFVDDAKSLLEVMHHISAIIDTLELEPNMEFE